MAKQERIAFLVNIPIRNRILEFSYCTTICFQKCNKTTYQLHKTFNGTVERNSQFLSFLLHCQRRVRNSLLLEQLFNPRTGRNYSLVKISTGGIDHCCAIQLMQLFLPLNAFIVVAVGSCPSTLLSLSKPNRNTSMLINGEMLQIQDFVLPILLIVDCEVRLVLAELGRRCGMGIFLLIAHIQT